MVWSSVLSDGVLAVVTLFFAWQLGRWGRTRMGAFGLGLVGIAAAIGSVRYLGIEALVGPHVAASAAAAALGLPLLGVAYVGIGLGWPETIIKRSAGMVIVLAAIGVLAVPDIYRTLAGGLAMAAVVGVSAWSWPRRSGPAAAGLVGALLTLVAGLVVGTEGSFGFVLRVDVFHYTLAAGNVGLALGLAGLAGRGDDR